MLPHLKLLATVLLIPFSVILLNRIQRIDRAYPTRYLRPFYYSILTTFIYYFFSFFMKYIHINQPKLWESLIHLTDENRVENVWTFIALILFNISLLFFVRTIRIQMGKDKYHWTEHFILISFSLYFITIFLMVFLPSVRGIATLHQIIRAIPIQYTCLLAVIMLLKLHRYNSRQPKDSFTAIRNHFFILFFIRQTMDLFIFLLIDLLKLNPALADTGNTILSIWDITYFLLTIVFTSIWLSSHLLPALKSASTDEEVTQGLQSLSRHHGLTDRERQIAHLVVTGKSNKEIGVALNLSASTIKNHIYKLYQKLDINSRFELIDKINEWERMP